MKGKRVIVWFRQDLRLHDNEALTEAMRHGEEIIPIFVFDERHFKGKTRFGFPKTGKYRARFIIESVADLQASLKALGSELIIRVGKPEEEIFKIARQVKSSWVFCNRERTQEEIQQSYEEAKSALLLIASKLNKGKEAMGQLDKFSETKQRISE